MTTIGTVAVAVLLTLGDPAVSTAQGSAVVLEGQRTVRSLWQLDRASIARDEWTSRRERLDRMRQRQQARAKIRALAGARALDRARTRAERAWMTECSTELGPGPSAPLARCGRVRLD